MNNLDSATPAIGEASAPPLQGASAQLVRASFAMGPMVVGSAVALAGLDAVAVSLALCGHILGVILAYGLMQRGYPHSGLGLCNLVTLTRLALTAALLAPLAGDGAGSWRIVALAGLALCLDGVDGWLARRSGQVSEFGARFDIEVDSAFALVLALNAWATGATGAIVLLLGLPRYVFAAATLAVPWLDRPLPARFSRKAVYVLQIGTLIALQLPQAMTIANPAVVLVVAAALIWSFLSDVAWLRRTGE